MFNVTGADLGELFESNGIDPKLTSFLNVEDITGGNGVDIITIETGANLGGDIDGAGSNDTFIFEGTGTIDGNIIGGTGSDTIRGNLTGQNIFRISGSGSGVLLGRFSARTELPAVRFLERPDEPVHSE